MNSQNSEKWDLLFRTEYGKLVATLTRLFGSAHIQQAEDIVQDALIAALEYWGVHGMPDNPAGWLMQVARRKALNELRRDKTRKKYLQQVNYNDESFDSVENIYPEHEISDNQLRMIFTCCHPSISTESQIAIILKVLCGFGVNEVARALITTESTIHKRLYRAKKSIRESQVPFDVPDGSELGLRLKTVNLTLYLLFNEGYNSSLEDFHFRRDLCLEAMRLCKIVVQHFPDHTEGYALLALMCFHAARFDARMDDHSSVVLFEDQDRTMWNKDLIHIGVQYLGRSMEHDLLSAYHIEANIAAEYCLATSFASTNWNFILKQYQLLEKLKPNPVIALNMVIIKSKIEGVSAAMPLLSSLAASEALANYPLLYTTQGLFYLELKKFETARQYLKKALSMTPSLTQKQFLQHKIDQCKNAQAD